MKITYTKHGDYYLPDLLPPQTSNKTLGKYAYIYLGYLKENKRTKYTNLLTSGKHLQHGADVGEEIAKKVNLLIEEIVEDRGITEAPNGKAKCIGLQECITLRLVLKKLF